MATPKKVKTITINSTKYQVGGEEAFIIKFNPNQSMFADGAKTCEAFLMADLLAAVKAGKPIKMICDGIEQDGNDWVGCMVFVPTVYYSATSANVYFNGYFPAAANIKKQFVVGVQNTTVTSITLDTV